MSAPWLQWRMRSSSPLTDAILAFVLLFGAMIAFVWGMTMPLVG
jgi:hypothetical protein